MYDRESESEFQVYIGHHNDSGQKEGQGTLKIETDRLYKYNGEMVRDNFHGDGVYTQIKHSNNFSYEGTLYANTFEGYGNMIHGNCVYFEGLFSNNKRFGPGAASHIDGTQDVGFWNGPDLMRLADVVNQDCVPKMARTTNGKIEILKNRILIDLTSEESLPEQFLKNNATNNPFIRNEKSFFFDRPFYDEKFNFRVIPIKEQSEVFQENEDYSPKEQCLLLQKQKYLEDSKSEIDVTESESSKSPKSDTVVEVSDLLVWNNENYLIEVLLECFRHRNREYTVKFITSKLLRKQRQLFRAPGTYETACRLFLRACIEGDDETMTKLHSQHLINPDVTDSEGNSGVLYAAARDHVYIIRRLVNFGGKVDFTNDENITALNMCILRYISLYKEITDWENAFLINPDSKNDENNGKEWLGQKLEDVALSSYHSYLQSENITADNEALILSYLKDVVTGDKYKINEYYSKLQLNNNSSLEFQSIFEPKEDSKQSYLFNCNLKPASAKVKASKPKKKEKSTSKANINVMKLAGELSSKTDFEKKLDIIYYTIQVLLKLGADPNLCSIPQPTAILALYCECPRLLEMLISKNMTLTDVYTADKLNLLHIVCSMPLSEDLPKMGAILLKNKVNPLQRCSPNHWCEEIGKIRGDVKPQRKSRKSGLSNEPRRTHDPTEEVEDEENEDKCHLGKTPLHILAIRLDFDTNPTNTDEDYLCAMAKNIGTYDPAVLEALYLEHTPLSLAVLKGNENLVQVLLEVGANPNQNLPLGMGTALTLYCLKRYSKPKMLPPVATCKRIMDILLIHGSSPLHKIGKFQNAIEFINGESAPIESADEKPLNKKTKKDKKSMKDGKSKASKTKSSQKIKTEKMTPQKELNEYLLQLAQDVILTHQQSKVVMLLFRKLMEGTVEDFKHLLEFLTREDGLRLIKAFCEKGILNLNDQVHYFLSYLLLECIDLHCSVKSAKGEMKDKKKKEKKDKDSKTDKKSKAAKDSKKSPKESKKKSQRKSSASSDISLPKKRNNQDVLDTIIASVAPQTQVRQFPLDVDKADLEVCYQCGLKTGKTLICCPKCGLVYFCSQKCNLSDTKTKSRHPCKLLFYDHELKKKGDKDATTVNNLEVTFSRLPTKMPTAQNIKKHKIFMDLLSAVNRRPTADGADRVVTYNVEKASKLLEAMNLKIDIGKLDMGRTPMPPSTSLAIQRSLRELLPISFSYIPGRISMVSNFRGSFNSLLGDDNCSSNGIFMKPGSALNFGNRSDLHFNLKSISVISTLLQQQNSSMIMSNMLIPKTDSESTVIQKERLNFIASDHNGSSTKQVVMVDRSLANKRMKSLKDPRFGRDIEFDFTHFNVSPSSEKLRRRTKMAFTREDDSKSVVNKQFIRTLSKMFPGFDFTTAMAPFVCLSDSQFYYKFADKFPEFFSTHM